ncbi:MAG: CpsD/CapB family tyrosine-protein kinase [Planctomycetota bacterium]
MIQKPATIAASPKLRRKGNPAQNERIDSILLRVEAIREENGYGAYVLGISGCDRRVGVSTIAGNLALRAAEMSLGKVLLVDANLNNPKQASNFRLGNHEGLADVLTGSAEWGHSLGNGAAENLSILSAGKYRSVQRVAMTPDLLKGLMNELKEEFDLIIMDLPPVRSSGRSMLLAGQVDGALLVLNAQDTRARDAESAIETLRDSRVEIVGTVLNRAKRTLPRWLERLF